MAKGARLKAAKTAKNALLENVTKIASLEANVLLAFFTRWSNGSRPPLEIRNLQFAKPWICICEMPSKPKFHTGEQAP